MSDEQETKPAEEAPKEEAPKKEEAAEKKEEPKKEEEPKEEESTATFEPVVSTNKCVDVIIISVCAAAAPYGGRIRVSEGAASYATTFDLYGEVCYPC